MARKKNIAPQASGTPSVEPRQQFLNVIASYEREYEPWQKRVEKIIKRYRDEQRPKGTQDNAHFNILWSNVQTLVPATFSKLPQPDVTRRFKDNDPVGRVASMILERSLDFEVQHYPDYRQTMTQSVYDRFLGGRGCAWVRYEPHFKQVAAPEGGVTDDAPDSPQSEVLDYECAPVDYVHWRDFGHDVARTWEEVTKVWRWVYMDEEAVEKRFGEELAGKLAYDASPNDQDNKMRPAQEAIRKQAKVCELWDKSSGKAYWFTKSYPEFLDERDDPLRLQEFFPCPRPLYATITNESLVPVPDFTLYQDQAKELDILADRIDGLAKMLQVKGIYDGSADASLARLFTEGENGSLMPVKNWAAFAEKGGLKGQIDVLDLKPIAEAFNAAVLGMKAIKEDVYEITGISDIVRGQTAASETATAQQIKGQYASLRLRSMQDGVAAYATDLLRLKAQVMCGKFDPKTLAQMAAVDQLSTEDQQHIQPALALLVGQERLVDPSAQAPNPMRAFRIEIAADTMVQLDEQTERKDKTEMLTAIGGYFEKALPVGQAAPPLIPLMAELGKFVVRSYKAGKAIEGAFDQALDQLKAQAANPQQRPDPEMEKVKMQAQLEQQKAQMQQQADAAKLQADQQRDAASVQADMQKAQMKVQSDEKIAVMKINADREIRMHEIQTAAVGEHMRASAEGERKDREFQAQREDKQVAGEREASREDAQAGAKIQQGNAVSKAMGEFAKAMREFSDAQKQLAEAMSADREIVRGPDGKAAGMRAVR